MKNKLTLLLISLIASFACNAQAQTKKDSTLLLSKFESAKISAHEQFTKQVTEAVEKEQKDWSDFVIGFLASNGVPLDRVSQHPDSLQITPAGITYKLRKEKAKKK
jgi:hypothetical protein